MADGGELVRAAREWKARFAAAAGRNVNKFTGAVTIEILRAALAGEGVATSARDVFVLGVPPEVDLILPFHWVEAPLGLVYKPDQVALALEVKNGGAYPGSFQKVRRDFDLLRAAGVRCAYLTLEEGRRYKLAVTEERVGAPCFTLAWHSRFGGPFEPSGDWARFLEFVRGALGRVPGRV